MSKSNEGFIKIHRNFLEWEWYTDIKTKTVFLHCILAANWKDGRFKGRVIPRGSFVSSLPQIAKQTELSIQNVRTAINHLKSTNELTVKTTSQYSVFTVVKYDLYQDDNRQSNRQPTGNQQATNRQLTTIEEKKEKKEGKKVRRERETRASEPEPKLYGVYHNVRLTDGEIQELINQYPEDYKDMIENLSVYMRSKGKLYDDHFATLMKWKREDEVKSKKAASKQGVKRNYSHEFFEQLEQEAQGWA